MHTDQFIAEIKEVGELLGLPPPLVIQVTFKIGNCNTATFSTGKRFFIVVNWQLFKNLLKTLVSLKINLLLHILLLKKVKFLLKETFEKKLSYL